MWRAVVFVEGAADARLVSDLLRDMGHANVIDGGRNIEPRLRLRHESAKENYVLVRVIGGVDNLIDSAKRPGRNMRFAQSAQKALVVLDANYSAVARRDLFARTARKWQHKDVHLFLLPDNKSDGALETLLRQIAARQEVFACIDLTQQCLVEKEFIKTPNAKGEIYAYKQANGIPTDEQNPIYQDARYWNLQAPKLAALRAFFAAHLP